ncbi:MAG: paraquat-inducible protein A [Hyphomicrobiaceae bacterium]
MLGGRRFLLVCAVSVAVVLLALGFYLPFMRLSTLLRIGHGAQEHSLMSAVPDLMRSNLAFLGGVLLALAVFLPLLKWLYLLLPALQRWTDVAAAQRTLAWLLRWWPQDVVAIAATAALIASRETLVQRTAGGAYCFAGAVLVMALACTWLRAGAAPGQHTRPQAVHDTLRGSAFAALVLLAIVAFALGVTLPVVRLAGTDTASAGQSIVDLVLALQARGETALWVPIAILALLLPGLRLLYLLTVAAARVLPKAIRSGAIRAAEILGRHATADTIALSLMLFYLMETREADRTLQPAVYCLAASAVLTLAAYAWANLPAPAPAHPQSPRLKERLEAVQEGRTA